MLATRVQDLLSFWGADVDAFDDNRMRAVDLADENDKCGAQIKAMLRKAENNEFFDVRSY